MEYYISSKLIDLTFPMQEIHGEVVWYFSSQMACTVLCTSEASKQNDLPKISMLEVKKMLNTFCSNVEPKAIVKELTYGQVRSE